MLNDEQLEFIAKELGITKENASVMAASGIDAIDELCMCIICDESYLEEEDDDNFNPRRFYMAESILRDI